MLSPIKMLTAAAALVVLAGCSSPQEDILNTMETAVAEMKDLAAQDNVCESDFDELQSSIDTLDQKYTEEDFNEMTAEQQEQLAVYGAEIMGLAFKLAFKVDSSC